MVRKPGKNTGIACFLFLAWLVIATGKPIQASADGMADDAPSLLSAGSAVGLVVVCATDRLCGAVYSCIYP